MNTARRISQVFFLLAFGYLFFTTVRIAATAAPVNLFFRIDPLAALSTMLAARQWEPLLGLSLIVVGATLVLGRIFCGWVCPFGTVVDLSDRYIFRLKTLTKDRSTPEDRQDKRWPQSRAVWVKYALLIGIIVAALLGTQFAYFLDPISILYRTFALVLFGPIQILLAYAYGHMPEGLAVAWEATGAKVPLLGGLGTALGESAALPQFFFYQNLLVLTIFVGVLALGLMGRRYWCRNLCPLGALLGAMSLWPFLRRRVSGKCNECALCADDCKMAAIGCDPREFSTTECIQCYACVPACEALATSIVPTLGRSGGSAAFDMSKRKWLGGAAIGIAYVALASTQAGAKVHETGPKVSSSGRIRPPGAVKESDFLAACIRCSECMKVCPTNALQPAVSEAGIEGYWTPVLTPRVGPCAQSCDLCGRICPTGAIEPFDWREKKWLYIGRATIDRSTCIAWYADKKCLICDEYCSYNAVYWEKREGVMRPFVDEVRCVGCGLCEAFCPIQPHAAIRVHSLGDMRELSRSEQLEIRKSAAARNETPEDPDVSKAQYRTAQGKEIYIPPEAR